MKRRYQHNGSPSGEPNAKRMRMIQSNNNNGCKNESYESVLNQSVIGRPLPSSLNLFSDNSSDLLFEHVETDYYIGFAPDTPDYVRRNPRNQRAVVRLYGVTSHGFSVLCHVIGFTPYFYVKAWDGFNTNNDNDLNKFKETLNSVMMTDKVTSGNNKCDIYVPKVSIVSKQTLWGYHFNKKEIFLKIYTTLPTLVPSMRRVLSSGIPIPGIGTKSFPSYESSLPFIMRFMIDKSIVGAGWIQLNKNKYNILNNKTCFCSLEITCKWDDIISRNEIDDIAPLRILSFDIECMCNEGFPDATKPNDNVIQIANVIQVQGSENKEDNYYHKNVFTLNTCAPIAGCNVLSFNTEKELLLAWSKFIQISDCDILTGYNIVNFDLPYLINRALFLNIDDKFTFLGRIKDSKTKMKDSTFSSRAYGTSNSKDIKIYGRIQMDLLPIIRREHKLRSYSLNNVSFHFLQQQKEDVHYSIIGDLQNKDEETRRRLAVYCLKDSVLPLRLMNKLMLVINHIEMARVTGVPISFLITRGQQIKVLSQLYRKSMTKDLLIPYKERGSDNSSSGETFEGATVIEPIRGFYTTPITTLDFASLYPSIMMAHNLCYTTMITKSDSLTLDPSFYTKTPTNNYFIKPHIQKGLLPEILFELLSARKKAKKEMKACKDSFKKAVLNGRQLALKISANSVYGFTGATVGSLPCLSISASVTSFGREMIDKTKEIVESYYNINNGYKYNAIVIYGDTDSVMIKFGEDDISKSMILGNEAAKKVSKEFLDPIELEFEKVYLPYLLMNKKRYAGMLYTKPDKYDYMDAKGIETVRRDNCELVKTMVQKVLDYILINKNVKLAEEYTKGMISNLLQNKIDMSSLVITKALGKIEDYKVKQAHVELALKMYKRDPFTAPKVGSRVAFVFTKLHKNARGYEKAEDPLYALENGIPLDTDYYLKHQLEQPLTRIFGPILGDDKVNSLFNGDHTRKISKTTSKVGAMMRFTVVKKVCIGCKAALKKNEIIDNNTNICKHCKEKEGQLYIKQMQNIRKCENKFHKLWTQCQRCQGSMTQKVLCTNRDCPIFYRRTKAKKDLVDAHNQLKQFSF